GAPFARHVDQHRGERAAVLRAVVDGGEHDHRAGGARAVGERQQQRDRGGGADARQHADDLAEDHAEQAHQQVHRRRRGEEALAQLRKELHPGQIPRGPSGSDTRSQVRKTRNSSAVTAAATAAERASGSRSTAANSTSSSRKIEGAKPIRSKPSTVAAMTAITTSALPTGSSAGTADFRMKSSARIAAASPVRVMPYQSGMKPDCGMNPCHSGMRAAATIQSRPSSAKKRASTSSPGAIRRLISPRYLPSRSR